MNFDRVEIHAILDTILDEIVRAKPDLVIQRHHVGQKPEYVMTAAEAEAYLAACVELESIPGALHRGRHYFPGNERCRCVKCGCTRAAAENTVCAERR